MKIANIVATGSLGRKIDLSELARILSANFRYEPEIYHCGYLEIENKSISIFSSGKYILVGLKNLDEIERLYSQMINLLDNIDINIEKSKPPSISNIVVCDEIERKLELNKLSIFLGLENVTYEPETFPGLIYRDNRTFNIYSTGKILAFGSDLEKIREDLRNLKSELQGL